MRPPHATSTFRITLYFCNACRVRLIVALSVHSYICTDTRARLSLSLSLVRIRAHFVSSRSASLKLRCFAFWRLTDYAMLYGYELRVTSYEYTFEPICGQLVASSLLRSGARRAPLSFSLPDFAAHQRGTGTGSGDAEPATCSALFCSFCATCSFRSCCSPEVEAHLFRLDGFRREMPASINTHRFRFSSLIAARILCCSRVVLFTLERDDRQGSVRHLLFLCCTSLRQLLLSKMRNSLT